MTARKQAIAAGVFIATIGLGLIVGNWYSVLTSSQFYVKSAWAGPFVSVYGIAHAVYAHDLRVLGDPPWARVASLVGLALAFANWYFLCHTACRACGLMDCF